MSDAFGGGPRHPGEPAPGSQGYRPVAPAPRKEPFFSLVASFFIPGLGTILNGETKRGAIFMACFYLGPVWAFLLAMVTSFVGHFFSRYGGLGLIPLFLLAVLASIGIWLWSMIDAYRGAEEHNMRYGLH